MIFYYCYNVKTSTHLRHTGLFVQQWSHPSWKTAPFLCLVPWPMVSSSCKSDVGWDMRLKRNTFKLQQRGCLCYVFFWKYFLVNTLEIRVNDNASWCTQQTAEPCSTAPSLIRLPVYNKKFRLFRRQAYMFSLKFTCLIRPSVNMDNRQFLVSRITNSHISSTLPRFADTVFQCTFYMIEYLSKEPNRNGKWWLAALDCLFFTIIC